MRSNYWKNCVTYKMFSCLIIAEIAVRNDSIHNPKLLLVPPYNDIDVIEGQGSCSLEIISTCHVC